MKNLAGVETADDTILEELYLAGLIPIKIDKGHTEVPYTNIATIGKWTLTRSWTYWVARVKEGENGMPTKGLPLLDAVALYNTKHPVDGSNLGEIIRAGGDAGSLSPTSYVAQPIYNDELNEKLIELGYEKSYHPLIKDYYIDISSGDVARLCNDGKLEVDRYVDCYHIDTQIGLNELAKVLKKDATLDVVEELNEVLTTELAISISEHEYTKKDLQLAFEAGEYLSDSLERGSPGVGPIADYLSFEDWITTDWHINQ